MIFLEVKDMRTSQKRERQTNRMKKIRKTIKKLWMKRDKKKKEDQGIGPLRIYFRHNRRQSNV
jgi:hypothetical protein